jgi:hypothetical protein
MLCRKSRVNQMNVAKSAAGSGAFTLDGKIYLQVHIYSVQQFASRTRKKIKTCKIVDKM